MSRERQLAEEIAARLREAGHRALLAGGCVRDILLGADPVDYDVATSARPEEVQALFAHSRPVGASYGVVLVLPDGKTPFDVATFRRDLGYTDLRRPDAIEFTDEEEDARRRDFTINGLFLDPATGDILDYVDARRDIERRVIRAIGDPDERIAEDRLRMLRAIRFAARFQFTLDRGTFEAIRRHASSIVHVSAERIRSELVRMLTQGDPTVALELLESAGLLQVVLPEVSALRGLEQPPDLHPEGDAWDHTLLMLARLAEPTPVMSLAVLLHDIGKPVTVERSDRIRFPDYNRVGAEMATDILARLRSSTEEREQVAELIRGNDDFSRVREMGLAELKRFLRRPRIAEHMELHRLDCLASHGRLDDYVHCAAKLADLDDASLRPPPLIAGGDPIAAGLEPGPHFRELLLVVEDAQLEGQVTSREQALALALEAHVRP